MIKEIKEKDFETLVLDGKEKVIVDFYADWCGPCKMLRPVLEELANETNDVKIVSINVDDAEELASKYGIISIPCLIMFQDGKEIKRSIGMKSKSDLQKIFEL